MSNQHTAPILARDGVITSFAPYPTIQVVTAKPRFRSDLDKSGLKNVADILTDDVASYWQQSVFDILNSLNGSARWTSRVVLTEIDRRGKMKNLKLSIWPRDYHPELLDPRKGTKDVLDMYLNASQMGREGLGGQAMLQSANQPGQGDHAIIEFDPSAWQPSSPILQAAQQANPQHYQGAGMSPEYVLFHELIHGMRSMKGITDLSPTTTSGSLALNIAIN